MRSWGFHACAEHDSRILTFGAAASIPPPRRKGRSAADIAHLDLGLACGGLGAKLRVAVAARSPDPPDRLVQLLVGGVAADECAQVVPMGGEEAGVEPSLGREAGPRAP